MTNQTEELVHDLLIREFSPKSLRPATAATSFTTTAVAITGSTHIAICAITTASRIILMTSSTLLSPLPWLVPPSHCVHYEDIIMMNDALQIQFFTTLERVLKTSNVVFEISNVVFEISNVSIDK